MRDEQAESSPEAGGGNIATSGTASASPTSPTPEGSGGLRQRVLGDLRHGAAVGAAAGGRAASQLGHAAEATALEIVPTRLSGERSLRGHVLGMRLSVPASHLHGPREAPSLVYLFADAVAIRPTDDAPMSTVPLFGLHMVLPPVAVARWVYKAGRMEHANLDLVKDVQRFADSLEQWTVEDFAEADPKLDVHRTGDLAGPAHVYQHLGFANVSVPTPEGRPVHLRSALPVPTDTFVKFWQLFTTVTWPQGLSTEVPAGRHEVPTQDRLSEESDSGPTRSSDDPGVRAPSSP